MMNYQGGAGGEEGGPNDGVLNSGGDSNLTRSRHKRTRVSDQEQNNRIDELQHGHRNINAHHHNQGGGNPPEGGASDRRGGPNYGRRGKRLPPRRSKRQKVVSSNNSDISNIADHINQMPLEEYNAFHERLFDDHYRLNNINYSPDFQFQTTTFPAPVRAPLNKPAFQPQPVITSEHDPSNVQTTRPSLSFPNAETVFWCQNHLILARLLVKKKIVEVWDSLADAK
ncbi:hypothetical protein TorRG33x02_203780 [Trema orientale]|uniref:Uncharacterized protein n=1 Tax=Trema orientale TaxID=63057 RepID=A0A2P5EE65_TREOI|nr:hypothetical protein TorRG33x02_203780 [Trema orientale]